MAKPHDCGKCHHADSHTVSVPAWDDKVLAVQLDRATVELLEARARARGITVAEPLAEYATSGIPDAEDGRGLHLKS